MKLTENNYFPENWSSLPTEAVRHYQRESKGRDRQEESD